MNFKQFYLGCLAHASYLIGSQGEAAVVDPQRDVDQYLEAAREAGLQIKYVIETHLHADFVSGHCELAERTGAQIIFGAAAQPAFAFKPVADGEELQLGDIALHFLATPGHTPESISVVVKERGVPTKVLTGDTLFIGDVGRPDLVAAKGFTSEQMAGMLFESLHEKLLVLHDEVEVYPAHGAGSLCGRNIGKETFSTIGQQRQFNYALRPMSKTEFIKLMTTDLPEAPSYFAHDVELNRQGTPALAAHPLPAALTPAQVQAAAQSGAKILDVRDSAQFLNAHIPGALNIGLNGQFASWAGQLLKPDAPLVLVTADDEQLAQVQTRLARVGFANVCGYLAGGMLAWHEAGLATAAIAQFAVDELAARSQESADWQIVDVRQPGEFTSGHVPLSRNFPLPHLAEQVAQLDSARPTAVICAGGYRSCAGASLLAACGFTNLFNVNGGTSAWINAGLPVEREIGAKSCAA